MLEPERVGAGTRAGNPDAIQVAVRVRPILDREAEIKGASESWRAIPHAAQVVRVGRLPTGASGATTCPTAFYFDHVFGKESTNEEVYRQVARPLVEGALQGYNGTVFAYGQTSSGKTHTMWGTERDPGVTRRAVRDLFDMTRVMSQREFLIRASYLEIYNETIRDLLHPQPATTNVRVLEDSDGRVFTDAREEIIINPEQVYELLLNGETKRMTGATDMNERSSRSHTILVLVIESRERAPEDDHSQDEHSGDHADSDSAVRTATLTLVDLAGSERQKDAKSEGLRLKEGGYINKSLLTLGTVINKLSEGNGAHIPYRDSKLTRMLQNSLGGNSRTAVICAITPASAHAEETLSTLKFATRAKDVQNRAQQNEVLDDRALLKRYQKEIAALRTQLARLQQGEQSDAGTSADAVRASEQNTAAAEREFIRSQLEEAENKRRLYEEKLEHLTRLILNSPAPTQRSKTRARTTSQVVRPAASAQDELGSPQVLRREPGTPPALEPSLDQWLARALRVSRRRTIGGSVTGIANDDTGPLTQHEARIVEQVQALMEQCAALNAARFREQSASLRAIRRERQRVADLQQNLRRLEWKALHRACAEVANEAIHQAALTAVDGRLAQIRATMDAERRRMHQLQHEVDQVRQACAEKQSRLEALERELLETRSELDDLRQRERAGFTQTQAKTFDHLRNRVSDLETKLRSQLALRQQVESSRSTVERELRKLERQNRALEKEIARMRDQRERIEHTKLSVAQAERLRSASEQAQQQLQVERDALQQQLSTLEREHAALVAERDTLLEYRARHKQACDELERAHQRIAELEAQSADSADWKKRCQSLDDELGTAKARIATLESQVESSARELASLLDQATDAHLQLEAVRSQTRASERMQRQLATQLREELNAMRAAHQNESAEWKRLQHDDAVQREALNKKLADQEHALDNERRERARLESRAAKLLQESAKHIQEKQHLLETIHARDRRIDELENRFRECVEGGGRYARLCKLIEKREAELGRARETLRQLEERLVAEGRSTEFCDLQGAAQREADLKMLEKQVARCKTREERAQQERQRLLDENHKLRELVKQKDRQLLGMQARLKTHEAEMLCCRRGRHLSDLDPFLEVQPHDANNSELTTADKENRDHIHDEALAAASVSATDPGSNKRSSLERAATKRAVHSEPSRSSQ